MANINDLPTELLLMIANLCDFGTHAALARTCRRTHEAINERLYKKGARAVNNTSEERMNPAVLCILQNNLPAMEKFLDYGMDVEGFVVRCEGMNGIRISWLTCAMLSIPRDDDFPDDSGTDMMRLLFRYGAEAWSSLPLDDIDEDHVFKDEQEESEYHNMGHQALHYVALYTLPDHNMEPPEVVAEREQRGDFSEYFDPKYGIPESVMRARIVLLMEKDVDIDCEIGMGTPLHCAALCNNLLVLKILLELGANVNSVTDFFGTPLDLARRHVTAKAMLTDAGGIRYGPPLSDTITRIPLLNNALPANPQ
ncbi:Protein of unknown function [Pyronema omphalodes CBS 100304]|uniref:F-box domain-containing protein n=1 Tax=Pyronema omphalodes (strain CBS 100304) TaxID=1076935 RepID=U4LWN4_PYROM|nr:Protein of unknown function [Pyronema omphalodes CBS 100304]